MLSDEQSPRNETAAVHPSIDWDALRAKSLRQGGFGMDRIDIWPQILHVPTSNTLEDEKVPLDESLPHADERQISLDTDRSFVLYPVEPKIDRETLQAGLNRLLVSLFRKRPRLSYFQGYHDIVTVIFLTLPEELQLPCVEKLSLHRLRDAMGLGLEPVLGLLRVTKNLLGLADPEYSAILEQSSPLPFYALSNLLTLFSHDMPTLPLIQHVFDYLLCRPPIAAVYLAAAIILARKTEVLRLHEEDEEGMIHSLLSSLPHIVDGPTDTEELNTRETFFLEETKDTAENTDETFFKQEDDIPQPTVPTTPEENIKQEQDGESILASPTLPTNGHIDGDLAKTLDPTTSTVDIISSHLDIPSESTSDIINTGIPVDVTESLTLPEQETAPADPAKVEESVTSPTHPSLALVDLLKEADALYEKFPPSHSGLRLSSIMGPQSVIFTWSESPSALPSDQTAEAMVVHPELIVYPYIEPILDHKEKDSMGGSKPARRKRRKLHKSPFGQMEKKTMLAGTVIVLGVAMAVYGIKARHAAGGHGLFYHADGLVHGNTKDWKRISGWLGGALAGASQKIMHGISTGR